MSESQNNNNGVNSNNKNALRNENSVDNADPLSNQSKSPKNTVQKTRNANLIAKNDTDQSIGQQKATAPSANNKDEVVQGQKSTRGGDEEENPEKEKNSEGKQIGGFIIGKTKGKGTFGKVKQGTHIVTGDKVAIKILEKDKIKDQSDIDRINREITILKKVRHPHVV